MDLLFYHGMKPKATGRCGVSSRRVDSAQLPVSSAVDWKRAVGAAQCGYAVGTRAARGGLVSDLRDPGPLGLAVNVIFLAYGVWQIWGTIRGHLRAAQDWFWGFTTQRQAELDEAGKHFAEGLAKGGLTLIELLVTHRALKFASRSWRRSIHHRTSCGERFREEKQKAESRKEGVRQRQAEQTEAERSRAAREATPKERKALERLQRAAKDGRSTRRG